MNYFADNKTVLAIILKPDLYLVETHLCCP